jgi:hypothetical protein
MTLYQIFLLFLAGAVFIGLPIAAVWSIVQHLRTPPSQRPPRTGVTAGFGAALQELDRLVARPSVEHTVETEKPILKREDDQDGD